MSKSLLFVAFAALTLAACGTPSGEMGNNVMEEVGNIVAADNTVAMLPAELTTTAGNRMPQPFVGRWGLTSEDCTGTAGNNKGLMVIAPDLISFYEARAAVRDLQVISPTEVRVTLALTREGQDWTQETPLKLEEGGTKLSRLVDGRKLQYGRCGA